MQSQHHAAATKLADLTLDSLKQAVKDWKISRPPQEDESAASDQNKQEDDDIAYSDKRRLIAQALEVNAKTIANWINNAGGKHALTLRFFYEFCMALGVHPYSVLPDCPQITTYTKIPTPVSAEGKLLELEQSIPAGRCKLVAFPLWSSPLLQEPLNTIYATKALYKRFEIEPKELVHIGEQEQANKFMDLRAQRRQAFENGSYILRLLFMRDEFERWVNRETLFHGCEYGDIAGQLGHIIELLKTKTWNDEPRLQMRMTKSYLRMQYGIFEQTGPDVTILNTNSGYLEIDHAATQRLIRKEFEQMWDDASYRGLSSAEEWIPFLESVKERVSERSKGKPERISIKSMVKAPKEPA